MTQTLSVHPENPQQRLLRQAADVVRGGGVIVYPTDSCYALGCHIGDKAAMERICAIRDCDRNHHFTLVCRDLQEIGTYAKITTSDFRLVKALTPGPYTFLLPATKEVPRRLQNAKRRSIGMRVPDHRIAQALLAELNAPLMSCTLILPGEVAPLTSAEQAAEQLRGRVDLVIDGGSCGTQPTTVIDLIGEVPQVVRPGKGPTEMLEA